MKRGRPKSKQLVKVKCFRCGKEFDKDKRNVDLCTNHYCSDTCRHSGTKPRKTYKGEEITTCRSEYATNS